MQFWLGALLLPAAQTASAIEPAPWLPRAHTEIVNSEYFVARLVGVSQGAGGSLEVVVAFAPNGLTSQAEFVAIRESCRDAARLIDGQRRTYQLSTCAPGNEAQEANTLWLEDGGPAVIRRYEFSRAGGQASEAPYEITIPVLYSKTTEEERPQPQKRLVLHFQTIATHTQKR